MSCSWNLRFLPLLLATCGLASARFLAAYQTSLVPPAIHEAYVLGRRNDHTTAEFMSRYISACSPPEQSCFVTQIELLTPFAQVVDASQHNANTEYSEQQALEDYRKRGDKVIILITLVSPTAYKAAQVNSQETREQEKMNASLRPENFWKSFRFSFKQRGRLIATRSIRSSPIYSSPSKDKPAVLDGATVSLEYDAKDIASAEGTVEVLTPESKTISANFDLKALR